MSLLRTPEVRLRSMTVAPVVTNVWPDLWRCNLADFMSLMTALGASLSRPTEVAWQARSAYARPIRVGARAGRDAAGSVAILTLEGCSCLLQITHHESAASYYVRTTFQLRTA